MATGAACNLVEDFGLSGNLVLNDPSILFYYAFFNTGYNITLNHSPTTVQINDGNNNFTLGDGNFLNALILGNGNDTVTTGVGASWGGSLGYMNLRGGTNTVTTGTGGIGTITSHGGVNTITTNGSVEQIQTSASSNTIYVGGTGLGVSDIHLYGSNMEVQNVTIELWVDTMVFGSGTVGFVTMLDGSSVSYARTGHNDDVFNLGNGFAGSVDMKNGDDVMNIEGGNANLIFMRGGDDEVNITGYNGTQTYMLNGGEGDDTLSFKGSKTAVDVSVSGLAVRNFETIIGTNRGDILADGDKDTTLNGGKGGDILNGGGGRDLLYAGKDTNIDRFVFNEVSDSHRALKKTDRIYQFANNDLIDLTRIDADDSLAGDQAFTFAGTTATANAVWYEVKGKNSFVRADVDGDAVADFSVLVMGTTSVTASDFIL